MAARSHRKRRDRPRKRGPSTKTSTGAIAKPVSSIKDDSRLHVFVHSDFDTRSTFKVDQALNRSFVPHRLLEKLAIQPAVDYSKLARMTMTPAVDYDKLSKATIARVADLERASFKTLDYYSKLSERSAITRIMAESAERLSVKKFKG